MEYFSELCFPGNLSEIVNDIKTSKIEKVTN